MNHNSRIMADPTLASVLANEPLPLVDLDGNYMANSNHVESFFDNKRRTKWEENRVGRSNESYGRPSRGSNRQDQVMAIIWYARGSETSSIKPGVGGLSKGFGIQKYAVPVHKHTYYEDTGYSTPQHVPGEMLEHYEFSLDMALPMIVDAKRISITGDPFEDERSTVALDGTILDPDSLTASPNKDLSAQFASTQHVMVTDRRTDPHCGLPFFRKIRTSGCRLRISPYGNLLLFDMSRATHRARFDHIRSDIAAIYNDYRQTEFERAYTNLDNAMELVGGNNWKTYAEFREDNPRFDPLFDRLHSENNKAVALYQQRMREKYHVQ